MRFDANLDLTMFHHSPAHALKGLFAFTLASCLALAGQSVSAQSEKEERKPMLRIVCVTSLDENQELVLASRDEEGEWLELSGFKLRSSFITEWLPARKGKLHLAIREPGGLRSICAFTFPASSRRAMLVLLPDPVKKGYHADVVDPAKLRFTKGSTLVVNYSRLPGVITLGSLTTRLKPGERVIAKPQPDANGMFRMVAAYAGDDRKLVPCYDRYVSHNQEARDILFLLPDSTLGLKVFSLSEFGPFD